MEDWQLGYLAGLVDAECHVGILRLMEARRKTPSYVVRFELAMTDRRPIEFVNSLLPEAKVIHMNAKGRRTAYYRLRLTQQEAIRLLRLVYPYVQGKRRAIELCLAIDELRRIYTPDRQHFGLARFQPLPPEFEQQAYPLWCEFRTLQLRKGRRNGLAAT